MNAEEYQKATAWLAEQKQLESQIQQSQEQESQQQARQEHLTQVREDAREPLVFARPRRPEPVIPRDVEVQLGTLPPQTNSVGAKDAPPSVFRDFNGRTFLTEILPGADDFNTQIVDDFIQTKMRVGKLQNSQENYRHVFQKLLGRANLSLRQDRSYVLQRLGLYLQNGQQYEDDDLVLTIIKGRRQHGSRRASK